MHPAALHTEDLNKGKREGGYSSRAAALVGRAASAACAAASAAEGDRISVKAKAQPAARGTIRAMFRL
jgi:hypothetical protein